MPIGSRKYKCDCCKRFFPKSKYGYYLINFKNNNLVLCCDCKKRYDGGYLKKFLSNLQFPLETYYKISNDKKCDICNMYYHTEKIKFTNKGDKEICQFCNDKII